MPFTLHHPSTIHEALGEASAFLNDCGVAEARLAIEWLFSRALGCARLELHHLRDDLLPPAASRVLGTQIKRLAEHEPLQYVQGDTEFMGRAFAVDRRALIPRPETEQLVETVLACAPLWTSASPAIADVGTGSGCIVISLALAKPEGQYQALDLDPATLTLARENAQRHGVGHRIRFTAGNLLDGLTPGSQEAVVSNPPYVRTSDWATLPSMIRDHEPRSALDGGPDGLAVIRPLITQAAFILKPGGRLFLEIGDRQANSVAGLLKESGFADIVLRPDFAGKTRIATARRADSKRRSETA